MCEIAATTKRRSWRSLVAVLFLTAIANCPASAAEIQDLKIGFSQQYTLGHWVPIHFSLSTTEPYSGPIELLLPDSDGVLARYPVPASSIKADGNVLQVSHYIRIGRIHSNLIVRMYVDEKPLDVTATLPTAYAGTDRMIVSLGADLNLKEAAKLHARGRTNFTRFVLLEETATLPERWWGYDGIDTLVITTDTPAHKQLTTTQVSAIAKWVGQGGNLILSVGNAGDELLAEGQLFAELTPGDFTRVTSQRRTERLESYVDGTESLQVQAAKATLRQSLLANIDGRLHAFEIGAGNSIEPIIIEQVRGFGRLVFVALDLNQPPLSNWADRDKLLGKLLQLTLPAEEDTQRSGSIGKVLHEGYTDVTGQLRNSLDQYEGVGLIAFSWIVGVIIVYLLLVAPGDYFFVNRLLKRPRLTWITLPLLVAIFCGAAYWLDSTFKAKRPRLNQIDLVDIDDYSQSVRGTSWHSLYSPVTRSFALHVSTSPRVNEILDTKDVLLSWQGLPGEGLGGMQSQANTALLTADYSIGTTQSTDGVTSQIDGLPIPISSSRALFTQWTGTQKTDKFGNLTLDQNKRISGQLTNPLPFPLKEGVLYHQNRIYRLPETWKPNRVIEVKSLRNSARDLESFLTGRAVRFDEEENFKAQWDPTSRDVDRIMQMTMFYRAAGGLGYTRLSHRYQSQLDSSTMLRNNRIVVVAKAENTATDLFDGDQSLSENANSWTIYRIVIPINELGSDNGN